MGGFEGFTELVSDETARQHAWEITGDAVYHRDADTLRRITNTFTRDYLEQATGGDVSHIYEF